MIWQISIVQTVWTILKLQVFKKTKNSKKYRQQDSMSVIVAYYSHSHDGQ